MYRELLKHFKITDPILYQELLKQEKVEKLKSKLKNLYFESLVSEIVSQQLSGKVADVIFGRLKTLLRGKITPNEILKQKETDLRGVGMSFSKARFILDLASKVKNKEISLDNLSSLSDEDVIKTLIKIKGIGAWTAEMFLMFTLGRENVFSMGDLGLKNAIKKLYNLENPSIKDFENISAKWSPYKSYACLVLWKSLDG